MTTITLSTGARRTMGALIDMESFDSAQDPADAAFRLLERRRAAAEKKLGRMLKEGSESGIAEDFDHLDWIARRMAESSARA